MEAAPDLFNSREEADEPLHGDNAGNELFREPRANESEGTHSERLEAVFDNEDADAAAAVASGQALPAEAGSADDASEEGGPKKRRRRRGGRRHRRNREGESTDSATAESMPSEGEDAPESDADPEGTGAEVVEATAEATEDSAEKPARRRRAVKGTVARKTSSRPSRKAPAVVTVPEPTPEPIPVPVVRSGSTDRHLVLDDIPVDPEPVRRPRSVRDLDAVPDDFD
jgi:ribonuclease E